MFQHGFNFDYDSAGILLIDDLIFIFGHISWQWWFILKQMPNLSLILWSALCYAYSFLHPIAGTFPDILSRNFANYPRNEILR